MTAFRFPARMTAFRFPAPVIVIVLVCLGSAEELSDMATMTTDEFIRYYGYKAETHDVTTEDGYILQVHRIVKEGGPPVIFQHGLLGASDSWVLRGPKSDLSFMLADEGYDIWLPDCRGNMYSQRHVNLTTADAAFWDFSWHEMGYYDMPAVVDHILNVTSYKNLVYLGHSMGTTMFYVFASTRPEYNEKIALSFSLAPIAFVSHMSLGGTTKPLANNARNIAQMFQKQGIMEILPRRNWLSKVMSSFCAQKNYQPFCLWYTFTITGPDPTQVNPETFPLFASHFPSGTSAKTLQHFAQSLLSGDFRMFSYGKAKNLEVYGTELAPQYNLSLITSPVSLHYSSNDFLSHPADVNILASKLPNLIGKFKVPFKNFNHVDYLWARDGRKLLYNQIMGIMNKHRSEIVFRTNGEATESI
nr:PREDICTED: lipase 1-like [Bemisia tabaci]